MSADRNTRAAFWRGFRRGYIQGHLIGAVLFVAWLWLR